MRVLVTGANGLLGHHVVMNLLEHKHRVRVIVRNTEKIFFDTSAVEIHTGNFSDYNQLKQAAAGCDAIIHIAAVTATNFLHYESYARVNVEGSQNIIKTAEESGINTLIFVSSANTIGYGSETENANEDKPIQYPFSDSFYAQSKMKAEKLFFEFSQKPDKHVIIVNPTFIIGAYDTKPSSGKMILMAYKRLLMPAPKGGKNFVDASLAATAICNALTMGKNGNRYLLSGVNLSFKDFYTIQKHIGRYKQKIILLPDFLLNIAGKAGDYLQKLNIKTDICTRNLKQLMIQEYYTNEKAKTELSLQDTDMKSAMEKAIKWFRQQKKIK